MRTCFFHALRPAAQLLHGIAKGRRACAYVKRYIKSTKSVFNSRLGQRWVEALYLEQDEQKRIGDEARDIYRGYVPLLDGLPDSIS